MLCELIIENVAVIEKANIKLKDGFTCLTGETGAGKSIIIDAINAITGERISKNIVRSGAEKASIIAVFENISNSIIHKAQEMFDVDISQECIVSRQVTKDGKSMARINSLPVPVAVIKELFSQAITIHGQHDNQSLLNPVKHIDILDAFGVESICKENYIKLYNEYTTLNKQISNLKSIDKTKSETVDFLSFQIDEIRQADISLQEEINLNEQKKLIKSSEKIILSTTNAYFSLSGDDDFKGAYQCIQQADTEIKSISVFSEQLQQISNKLSETAILAQDAMFELKSFIDDFDVDIKDIDEIEERLDTYYKIKRKYGPDVQDVLEFYEKACEELENIEFAQEKLDKLEKEKALLTPKVLKAADELSLNRSKVFKKLSKEIQNALIFLNMPFVELSLKQDKKELSLKGQDDIEFMIVTNKGESAKPLAKIASGGELSRIMLAIKSVLAEKEDTHTLIFDEIDAGVSGSAALKIGRLLKQTAVGKQVLCVTHSPQIAAFSHNHLLIEKKAIGNATFTSVRELEDLDREKEIARIISGDNISETALMNAREMIHLTKNS